MGRSAMVAPSSAMRRDIRSSLGSRITLITKGSSGGQFGPILLVSTPHRRSKSASRGVLQPNELGAAVLSRIGIGLVPGWVC